MALINRPMYEQFGARHLGVKGPGALTNLEEGVMGVLPLDMMSDPAYWYIQGIRVFSAFVGKGSSGAGTFNQIGIALEDSTPESPVIARVLGIIINEPITGTELEFKRVARTSFSSDPGVYGYSPETRVPEGQHSQCVMISAQAAATPGTRLAIIEPGTLNIVPTVFPMIISPGEAIYCINSTATQTLQMTWIWSEIPAYKAEL